MRAKQWLDRAVYLASMGLSGAIRTLRKGNPESVRSILCFKEDEIGDFMYSIPVYEMLNRHFPNASLTVLCKPFGVQLLQGNPHVSKVVTSYRELDKHYDLMIDLRGTPASTWFALTHPPKIRLDRGTVRIRQRREGRHPHESETAWEIVRPILPPDAKLVRPRIWLSEGDYAVADAFVRKHNAGKMVLIHTGARRILKKWPLEQVSRLLQNLQQRYGYQPVLIGDTLDAADAETLIREGCNGLIVAAGQLSLRGFAALCDRAELFIGNDSGPLHVAAAMGLRSIGLFGPGDPIFHPIGTHTRFAHHILECNPCDQVHCKYPNNPCIQRIQVEEVESLVADLLAVSR
jgi:ADP-heptose:LPS heptosyltransferase